MSGFMYSPLLNLGVASYPGSSLGYEATLVLSEGRCHLANRKTLARIMHAFFSKLDRHMVKVILKKIAHEVNNLYDSLGS